MKIGHIGAASLALALAGAAIGQQTRIYTIDYFPELPVDHSLASLSFDPRLVEQRLNGAQVTETRLYVTFTTRNGFDASALTIQVTAPIDSPTFGSFLVTGAQLGWAGEGTFTAEITSNALTGTIPDGGRAIWFFDLFGNDNENYQYSGEFSADSLIEFDYIPSATAPCPADFNHDGAVDPDDLSDFISGYFSVPPDAATDFNQDENIDPDDLADFISAFFAPC